MEKTTRHPGGYGGTPHAPRSGGLLGSRPEPFLLDLDYYGITRRGSAQPNNEDSLLLAAGVDRTLFAVADGIGGRSAGEVASAMAVEALEDLGPEDPLEAAIQQAHSEILAAQCEERLAGMGTTLVAVRFFGLAAEIAHVGDSRAYLVRDGWLRPLTEDHSLANELLRAGVTTPARIAKHPWRKVVTRALGAGRRPRVENKSFDVVPGDRVVLCSDGLSDVVPEAAVAGLLEEHPRDPEGAARRLAAAAREAGSPDDVTVVVVDAKGPRRTFARFVGAERGHPACFPSAGCPGAGRPGSGGDVASLPRGRPLRRAQPEGGAPRSPQAALGPRAHHAWPSPSKSWERKANAFLREAGRFCVFVNAPRVFDRPRASMAGKPRRIMYRPVSNRFLDDYFDAGDVQVPQCPGLGSPGLERARGTSPETKG